MKAIAVFQGRLSGHVTFTQTDSKSSVRVYGNVHKVPTGKHGFHVHKFGNLLESDCSKCGGHFNPFSKDHGGRHDKDSHAGDLGNITATQEGESRFSFSTSKITLYGKHSIIGRSIVIHEGEDDLGHGGNCESLKTGNSGARIDCAVIGISSG